MRLKGKATLVTGAGHGDPPRPPDDRLEGVLAPGLCDLQVNGAAGHEVTAGDLVDRAVEPLPGHAALELKREQAVVAAGQDPRRPERDGEPGLAEDRLRIAGAPRTHRRRSAERRGAHDGGEILAGSASVMIAR